MFTFLKHIFKDPIIIPASGNDYGNPLEILFNTFAGEQGSSAMDNTLWGAFRRNAC
jgi:hypothetical protein